MGGASTSQAANDTRGVDTVVVKELTTIAEMHEAEAIQRDVWGLPDIDVVPASQMKAAAHAGGHLAGAFAADEMVGFAYGLVALPHDDGTTGIGLHSHMVAVREQGRQRGTGKALKWFQRQWCLDRGMRWMTWTFDPLQARNANLNFQHLGVVSREYLVDFYGVMSGPLGSDASDRLVALWLIDTERVRSRLVAGPAIGASSGQAGTWLLHPDDIAGGADDGGDAVSATVGKRLHSTLGRGGDGAARLFVAVPADVAGLRTHRPEVVKSWRDGIRAAIIPALESGYQVIGFIDGAYVLERVHESEPGPKAM